MAMSLVGTPKMEPYDLPLLPLRRLGKIQLETVRTCCPIVFHLEQHMLHFLLRKRFY
jgi:hypothetical protein